MMKEQEDYKFLTMDEFIQELNLTKEEVEMYEKLKESMAKDIPEYDFNKSSGYVILPDGRIAYTKDNSLFHDDEDWDIL